MHAIPVVYKGWTLTPLAVGTVGSFASMLIIVDPDGDRRAMGSLGDFTSEVTACQFAIDCGQRIADGRDYRKNCVSRWSVH
ncbi:hypothetical protein SBC1_75750 (plasmid) [Caballeronia sp. SBC1]|uniref:hypothetical protein n=1 Tax=unclassified Caballeronia TaxID=2646786 RepID=UPI0013E122A7|nr:MULTISPECIES: hypothetical protein [unclassified Caballeronia]QIE30173.1 hypothetical protein SBC2_82490 [Caballeronia sp. SBC2]QIN67528.1 hypothetical protein SBC1_75750 [Caballeronia sp. SBC1]